MNKIQDYAELISKYRQRMSETLALQDEWHRRRFNGIGGSEMASVLGISKYQSAYDLWQVKTGRKQAFNGNDATHWGQLLESAVAEEYARITGEKIRVSRKHYTSKDYPWLVGNVDRLILKNDQHDTKILECKTCTDDSAVDEDGLKEWGQGNTYHPKTGKILKADDTVPFNYLVQVQHYMFITGYKETDLAVLFMRTRDFRIYTIKRNEEIINAIIEKSAEFWRCVLTDTEPEMTDEDWLNRLTKTVPSEEYIQAPSEDILQTVGMLKDIKKRINQLEEQKEQFEEEIKLYIGDKKGLMYDGKKLVTYGNPYEKVTFDAKQFKADHPDMLNELSKYDKSTTIRQLRINTK